MTTVRQASLPVALGGMEYATAYDKYGRVISTGVVRREDVSLCPTDEANVHIGDKCWNLQALLAANADAVA